MRIASLEIPRDTDNPIVFFGKWSSILNPALSAIARLANSPPAFYSQVTRLQSGGSSDFPGLTAGATVAVIRPTFSGKVKQISTEFILGNNGYGTGSARFGLYVNSKLVPNSVYTVEGEFSRGASVASGTFSHAFRENDLLEIRCMSVGTAFGNGTANSTIHFG